MTASLLPELRGMLDVYLEERVQAWLDQAAKERPVKRAEAVARPPAAELRRSGLRWSS